MATAKRDIQWTLNGDIWTAEYMDICVMGEDKEYVESELIKLAKVIEDPDYIPNITITIEQPTLN